MRHVTMIESTPSGYLGRCETCAALQQEFAGWGEAQAWCDDHEHYPNRGRGGSVGPIVLERYYRKQSDNPIFTPVQRAQWLVLADEMADRLKPKSDTIDGQMSLFGED